MNRRTLVLGTTAAAIAVFGGGAWLYTATRPAPAPGKVVEDTTLIRPHSPILGPVDAPVTVVKFFDPACESCRAFHPVVKEILSDFAGKVRAVMRYAPLHAGSDEAVRILETARLQDKFEPVLDGLYAAQPIWAAHGAPRLDMAWQAAGRAGLDIARAQQDRLAPAITAVLTQDMADMTAIGLRGTPTFFVNGKPLVQFGLQQLYDQVRREVDAV